MKHWCRPGGTDETLVSLWPVRAGRFHRLLGPVRATEPPAPAFRAAVGQDLPDHVTAGYAGDPAASVGGRPGLVQAADRGAQVGVAGRGPGVAHLPQRPLP